jgi:hypothetical protein
MDGDPYGAPHELRRRRPQLDERRFRAAGLATSFVAALIGVVGILIARGVFSVQVLSASTSGVWGGAATIGYAVIAFGCGLLATALMVLLLRTTPSPITYFGWIVGLMTAVAAVIPLTMGADVTVKIATALINAAVGTAVGTLTVSAARRSILYVPPSEPELGSPYG